LHFAFSLCNETGEITAVSYGKPEKDAALIYALARGVTSLVRIEDEADRPAGEIADPTIVARVLASWLRGQSFDIIICGNPSSTGVIPALSAGYLGIPCVSRVYAG